MANLTYAKQKIRFTDGTDDWDAGTWRVLLTTSTYVPSAAHEFVSSVTNELAGGGYARQDLTTRTVAANGNNADLKADQTAYTGLTNGQTAAWAIVYKFVTNDADSTLACAIDLTPGIIMTGDVTIKWDNAANGAIMRVS